MLRTVLNVSPRLLFSQGRRALASLEKGVGSDGTLSSFEADKSALDDMLRAYSEDPSLTEQVDNFSKVVAEAPGVKITGIGKSGYVGRRMAATLASVGIPAHFVHGTEWVHGDLGALKPSEIVVAISHSGKTNELLHLAPFVKEKGAIFCAMVGFTDTPLGNLAEPFTVIAGPVNSEILGSVPSRSIVVQEALINAIATNVINLNNFKPDGFKKNHPGGAIGASP
jgi:arabinose-5-phosphate isomerase